MSKFQQRLMCFETNSSSMHTLQISEELMEENKLYVNSDGYVHVTLDEFYGRDYREYVTQEEKLKYICTWMYIYYGCDLEELENGYEWEAFTDKFCKYINHHMNTKMRIHLCEGIKIDSIKPEYDFGGVGYFLDHQSCPNSYYNTEYDFGGAGDFLDHQSCPDGYYNTEGFILDFYDTDMLVNFVFNPYMWLRTESD